MWLSGLTFLAVFAPTLLLHVAPQLPGVVGSERVMLAIIALAHGMFLLVLLAVVVLREGRNRAAQSAQGFRQQAQTDVLAGLANRRALEQALADGLAISQHGGVPMAVALIDIDHVKRINDQHGHAIGDAVLREWGPLMQAELRATDRLGRWGGAAFLLLAHNLPMSGAAALAEPVRVAVEAHAFVPGQTVTVSIGVAQALTHDTPMQLLLRADRALYRAKDGGRNRTETRTVEAA